MKEWEQARIEDPWICSQTRYQLRYATLCFDNSVDPDHLASEKPADQDPHCFPLVNTL